MEVKIIELTIIIGYAIFMMAIGLYFRKRAQSSTSSFWSADANVGWLINSFAVLATIMSGGGMLGNIGLSAALGVCYIGMGSWSTCTGIGMAAIIVAPPLRKTKARTLSDFFHIRYEDKRVGYLVAAVIVIAYTVYLVSQMKASGTVGEYILGTNYFTAMVLTWLVFTLYTVLGGMLAVTWTDFIQGCMMIIASVACAVAALMHFGGLGNIYSQATAVYPNMGVFHLPYISYAGFFIIWFLVQMCAPTVLMRVATSKSPFNAGVSMHAAMFLLTVFTIGTLFIVGPACRAVVGPVAPANNDAFFLFFLDAVFGPVMKGVVGAAIFAAIMSTAAGLLLAASAALSNDIIARVKKLTPKGESRVALLSTLAIAVVVLLLSFKPPEYLSILYTMAMSFLMCCLFVPFMAGLWWKRATPVGAISAIIGGALSYVVALFLMDLPQFSENFIALPISLICLVVGSLLSAPPSEEKIREIESWHEPDLDETQLRGDFRAI